MLSARPCLSSSGRHASQNLDRPLPDEAWQAFTAAASQLARLPYRNITPCLNTRYKASPVNRALRTIECSQAHGGPAPCEGARLLRLSRHALLLRAASARAVPRCLTRSAWQPLPRARGPGRACGWGHPCFAFKAHRWFHMCKDAIWRKPMASVCTGTLCPAYAGQRSPSCAKDAPRS